MVLWIPASRLIGLPWLHNITYLLIILYYIYYIILYIIYLLKFKGREVMTSQTKFMKLLNFTIHVDFRRIIWSQHSIALLNLTLTSWFLARWTASIFLNISVNPIISPEFSPNRCYLESHNFTYRSRYSSRFLIGSNPKANSSLPPSVDQIWKTFCDVWKMASI